MDRGPPGLNCQRVQDAFMLACAQRARVLTLSTHGVAEEANMFDNGQFICHLAADTVMSAQACASATRFGVDLAKTRASLANRLVALAEEFYATEEVYAMEACFRSVGKAGIALEKREPLPSGNNGVIYALVANFIASLVPDAGQPEDSPDAALSAGLVQGERLSLLFGALSQAGYLERRAELRAVGALS